MQRRLREDDQELSENILRNFYSFCNGRGRTTSISPPTSLPLKMNGQPQTSTSPTGPLHIPPPDYVPTGNEGVDRLAFFHILERLKTQKRAGWVREGVKQPESISDHMYRMGVLALCCPNEGAERPLDIGKCVMMAIVHDLAEAHVGDITPVDGVSKEEKHRREREAMRSFLEDMLHGGEAARRIGALWDEYEDGITPEAKFVKDLDRLELTLQAIEYERAQGTKTIGTFVADTVRRIRHPAVQDWARDALVERTQLYEERGDQAELWQGVDVEKLGEPVVGDWVAKKN